MIASMETNINYQRIEQAIRYLEENFQRQPELDDVAEKVHLSPFHFQRLFTRAAGLSPAAYGRALREERAKHALGSAGRVTDAIYDAGYEAPSRFYAAMEGRLGMAASDWKKESGNCR